MGWSAAEWLFYQGFGHDMGGRMQGRMTKKTKKGPPRRVWKPMKHDKRGEREKKLSIRASNGPRCPPRLRFCIVLATARLATRGHEEAANAIFDASLHPKVKTKCEKGGALATANQSFTKTGMKHLCF